MTVQYQQVFAENCELAPDLQPCDCGQPAAHRLQVQFHMLYKRTCYRPLEHDSYRVSHRFIYLCPVCFEREQRQKEGYK